MTERVTIHFRKSKTVRVRPYSASFVRWSLVDRDCQHEHPGGHSSRRAYEKEIHKRINHFLREQTCLQMECSKDAVVIE